MIQTTNNTKLLGLIGSPVEHTISPEMHSFMANKFGFDFSYLAFDVKKEDLSDVILSGRAMGVRGFNITAPHKIEVMKSLDYIDDDAALMGSVNTVVYKSDGIYGYNTDGDGLVNSLEFEGAEIFGKKVLMLGAGGSARSISYKLAKKGVARLDISSRSKDKTQSICECIEKNIGLKVNDEMDKSCEYDVIINTTPLGMYPDINKTPFDNYEIISEKTFVCDIIYNPKKTILLKEAEKRGANIANGLSMLVLQGIYAFEHFADFVIPDKRELYTSLMKNFSDFNISMRG